MSSARTEEETKQETGSVSSEGSPTDTTPPSRTFEPITKETDDDDDNPTGDVESSASGTVRRTRPQRISTGGLLENYGTMQSLRGRSEDPNDGQRTPTQPSRTGISSPLSTTPARSGQSPESAPQGAKPKLTRRASSKHHPHKGQEFSVDDDPEEYHSDIAQRRGSQSGKSSAHGLRTASNALRRRPTNKPSLPRIDSRGEDIQEEPSTPKPASVHETALPEEESSDTMNADDEEDDDDNDVSDAESFTLKDKQTAINQTHPFGIRIWKPALYKKNRSVEKTAEGDIHSSPGARVSRWLAVFNFLWTILFGWWLALAAGLGALVCYILIIVPGACDYGRVFWGLSGYLLFPFGKFVKLEQDEAYAEEDEGEGRSISEYEQWQQGDLEDGRLFFGPLTSRSIIGRRRSMDSQETESLLGRTRRGTTESKRERRARLFGRGQWTFGRVIFFVFFYFLIAPLMLLASLICWFLVFWIPMARATGLLFYHLRRHPLALSFHSDATYSRSGSSRPSSILLCTYRAVGSKYWKYTIDGTNIFLINLLGVVLFAIFNYFVLHEALDLQIWITHPFFVFALALFSIIPLAYFIGQAVASISAQSSMGVGAAINAFFSTVVEVFLYCVALNQGKGQLVEGSIIGSIFAGILFLPGLSMCFGALKRKTQRFNVRSAGVTSTMLLFATIAAFGPTLFYQIYGSHELSCHACSFGGSETDEDESCRRCYFTQAPTIGDGFYVDTVRPYCWFAAVLLFLSYAIGLWFTLRTHAAVIWNAEVEEKKAQQAAAPNGGIVEPGLAASGTLPSKPLATSLHRDSISKTPNQPLRDSVLYKRILSQTLKQDGLALKSPQEPQQTANNAPHLVPPKSADGDGSGLTIESSQRGSIKMPGLSEDDSHYLIRHVAEMAATAAAAAAREATQRTPRERKPSVYHANQTPKLNHTGTFAHEEHEAVVAAEAPAGGHDAPNWSRTKSAVILLGATVLYAIIAEILVNTVDSVLESVDIDEKFLGITLFALVPNTTEFLNAISFAMHGNIALSMEIGSAYALQVCLLQIPALVLFSALWTIHSPLTDPALLINHTFTLIFPQWDMVTVILCVFLLSYVYGEGKSNYFKGSILCLTYFVIVVGFYLAGNMSAADIVASERFGLGAEKEVLRTVGRKAKGFAYSKGTGVWDY